MQACNGRNGGYVWQSSEAQDAAPNLGQTEAESGQYNDYGGNAASKACVNTSDSRAISQYASMYMSAQDAERQTK